MKWTISVLALVLVSSIFCQTDLKIATCVWEPYMGPELENNGYLTEITMESLKTAGYSSSIEFLPWNRAVEQTKKVQYQVLMGAYYSDERAEIFEFSDNISSAQIVFFKRKDANIAYEKLEDLKSYSIAAVRGFVYTDEFDNADYLIKDYSENINESLVKLINKRVDLAVGARNVVLSVLQEKFPENYSEITIMLPPLQINNLHVCFPKSHPDSKKLVKDFNKGFKMIKENGKLDQILQKHGF